MRLKSFDNILITLMSAVALLCIYMLYGTKMSAFDSGSEIKVASIVEQLKTVKRKKDFYQGWMDVKTGDDITENDEIYTHGQSSAKIKFNNGPEISLFENSLLRIKNSAFSLDKGNLIAKLTPESPDLNITLNGKKYSFTSQDANIQIEQGALENKFLLLNGKAKLADQEILANQVVVQNIKTGELKIKAIPFVSKLPAHNLIQYFINDGKVHFEWSYIGEPAPVKLQISKSSTFDEILTEETIDENNFNMIFQNSGTYYWRLTSKDDVSGPIKSFTLIEETPPVLNIDQTVLYQTPKTTDKAFLSWQKSNAKNFLVKIESPEGKNQEVSIQKNSYEFAPDQLGKYLVSVKIQDENRPHALWSDPALVTVEVAKPVSITSLTPDFIEKVNYNNTPANYLLSWSGPNSGITYKVKIKTDSKILDQETEHTSLPVNLNEAGNYEWEIQGITTSGLVTNKLTGKIILKAPLRLTQLPSEGAVIELEKPDQLVSFKWDKVEEASLYQFELSDEPTFKKIIVARDVDANNIATSLANTGRYFWRVKIKKGEKVEYSNPVSVEIKPAPPLDRPDVSPDIKIKLKYEETSSTFNLLDFIINTAHAVDTIAVAEWSLPANPRAKTYNVEIYKDAELKELITKFSTEVPHAVWKNAAPGKFYWRVSYTDFWGRETAFSKVSVLATEMDEAPVTPLPPPDIELTLPKHRADVLANVEESLNLSWEAVEGAKNYQVLIATDLEFEHIIAKKKVTTNDLKTSCQAFENKSGEYYWKVTSGEISSKRRMFKTTCAPVIVEVVPPVEKRPEPEVVQPTIVSPEPVIEKKDSAYLKISYLPHHVTYKNKASQYSAKVDGNVINSWGLSYYSPIDSTLIQGLLPSLSVERGKVFESITFTDIEFNLKAIKKQSHFSWGPMASFMKKTIYVENNLKIADESLSSPLLGIFIQKELGSLLVHAEVKFGSILDYQIGGEYKINNRLSAGAFLNASSVTKDDNKHSFSKYGLNLNYTFDFLDNK